MLCEELRSSGVKRHGHFVIVFGCFFKFRNNWTNRMLGWGRHRLCLVGVFVGPRDFGHVGYAL